MPVINGSDLLVYINGALFGMATSIKWNIDYGRKSIRTIDLTTAAELAPGQFKITGTMDIVKLHYDGGVEGQNLVPIIDYVTMEKYITISVMDRANDNIIFNVAQALIKSQSWSASPKRVVTGSVSFEAITYQNELQTGITTS